MAPSGWPFVQRVPKVLITLIFSVVLEVIFIKFQNQLKHQPLIFRKVVQIPMLTSNILGETAHSYTQDLVIFDTKLYIQEFNVIHFNINTEFCIEQFEPWVFVSAGGLNLSNAFWNLLQPHQASSFRHKI